MTVRRLGFLEGQFTVPDDFDELGIPKLKPCLASSRVWRQAVNLLLDTHLLLCAASDPTRLSVAAQQLIGNENNTLHFSVASLWEIVVKGSLKREDFDVDASLLRRGLINNGYKEISIGGDHALAVASLPTIHCDPFDRMFPL